MAQSPGRCGFHVRHSVRNYTHNSMTEGGIRTFYLSHDCSTIGRCLFCSLELYARYDRRVMSPNTERKYFLVQHFVRSYTRNSNTTCRMVTALLSEMSIFRIRAGWKIPIARYVSENASQSLSDRTFLRIQCNYNLKTSGQMWKVSISNDCYIIGQILCVV